MIITQKKLCHKSRALRTREAIDSIKAARTNLRDLAIFVVGINTNLRECDLLRITVGQARKKPPVYVVFQKLLKLNS